MSNFTIFQTAINNQIKEMSKSRLFRVDTDSTFRNNMWKLYINSFPGKSNPVYKERTEHDCQCCKYFVRTAGGIVTIKNNNIISIWDINIGGHYQTVADAMSKAVKQHSICNVFLHYEKHVGTFQNKQLLADKSILTWDHFYSELPSTIVKNKKNISSSLSVIRSSKGVFKRSLKEITQTAIETVIELIQQKSLYRGEESLSILQKFLCHKKQYSKLNAEIADNYIWDNLNSSEAVLNIRNTALGTLLIDLSENVELDKAVTSFEAMVAPVNYKRPTALITKSMIVTAQEKIEELGLTEALQRRYAITEDLTINNILFADRSTKKLMNVFDEMSNEIPVKIPSLAKIEEVTIDTFINDILPTATTIEILPEKSHINNLVSLIAPINVETDPLFKWDNNFSWAYKGDVTDSIKERVKSAGGDVTGILRCSLSWFNYDDLDLHVIEPNGNRIWFSKRRSVTGGNLDVDMNIGSKGRRDAVENITWPVENEMLEGTYRVRISNFTKRENIDIGFEVELEYKNKIYNFNYPKAIPNKGYKTAVTFKYTKNRGIEIISSIKETKKSQEIWGIQTNTFNTVEMVMFSPNYWDEQKQGNKHIFFMLKNCINDEPSRGFFNEFLNPKLTQHRKVLEVLGTKTKTACSNNQISGFGFSTTQRNSITCKITGTFNRTIKLIF